MILINMRPTQLQEAVKNNIPVIMAAGVVEYHGPHLPLGTDILISSSICEEVEKRCKCVLAPPIPFGPTMSWAGGAYEGEMDFNPEPLYIYAKEVFRNLLKIGFRKVFVVQHHQGMEGLQALCLKKAAAELMREEGRTLGDGWGRNTQASDSANDIFGMIQIAGPYAFSRISNNENVEIDFSHAAKGETQFILATYPQTVDLTQIDNLDPTTRAWLGDACEADALEGEKWLEYCVNGWIKKLSMG